MFSTRVEVEPMLRKQLRSPVLEQVVEAVELVLALMEQPPQPVSVPRLRLEVATAEQEPPQTRGAELTDSRREEVEEDLETQAVLSQLAHLEELDRSSCRSKPLRRI